MTIDKNEQEQAGDEILVASSAVNVLSLPAVAS